VRYLSTFLISNTYANLGRSLIVRRCIDTLKCGNCAIKGISRITTRCVKQTLMIQCRSEQQVGWSRILFVHDHPTKIPPCGNPPMPVEVGIAEHTHHEVLMGVGQHLAADGAVIPEAVERQTAPKTAPGSGRSARPSQSPKRAGAACHSRR
jgi:hypothetical protein